MAILWFHGGTVHTDSRKCVRLYIVGEYLYVFCSAVQDKVIKVCYMIFVICIFISLLFTECHITITDLYPTSFYP